MYKLRHIIAALLSLLIIYTGAGVAIAHYCCVKCEAEAACHCSNESCCPDAGCSTVFYKIDLVKEASSSLSMASLFTYSYQAMPDFHFNSPVRDYLVRIDSESPPILPRCYLALYSVLLI